MVEATELPDATFARLYKELVALFESQWLLLTWTRMATMNFPLLFQMAYLFWAGVARTDESFNHGLKLDFPGMTNLTIYTIKLKIGKTDAFSVKIEAFAKWKWLQPKRGCCWLRAFYHPLEQKPVSSPPFSFVCLQYINFHWKKWWSRAMSPFPLTPYSTALLLLSTTATGLELASKIIDVPMYYTC